MVARSQRPGDPETASLYPFVDTTPPTLTGVVPGKVAVGTALHPRVRAAPRTDPSVRR